MATTFRYPYLPLYLSSAAIFLFSFFLNVSTSYGSHFIDTAKEVLAESPSNHIARKDMDIAAAEKKIVRATYLPQLSLEIESGRVSENYDDGEFRSAVTLSQYIINVP